MLQKPTPTPTARRHGNSELSVGAAVKAALGLLTPKRRAEGVGLDGWYPYYAGFSYDFVQALLHRLPKKRRVVLDPWNGSGTTTAAAFHSGHSARGFDLNPAVVTIANAKLVTREELHAMPSLLHACLNAEVSRSRRKGEALLRWLPPSAAHRGRSMIDWLCAHDGVDAAHLLTPPSALAAVCILRGMREFAVDTTKSNSSWIHPNSDLSSLHASTLKKAIIEHSNKVTSTEASWPKTRPARTTVKLADAGMIPLRGDTVDLVITSPPYCTRVDYARQTGFEIAALTGMAQEDSRELRNSLMGTTTIRGIDGQDPQQLPKGVSSLLRKISAHPSHRSQSYYGRNFQQYFDDASRSIGELARLLRPGGKALLVLQNSYYKEIEIPLSKNYCELGKAAGLKSKVLARTVVPHSMTSINSRSKKYIENKTYTEDIVLMEKRES